jgi:DNA-binding beta-propeller fold protein YncE
MSVKINSFTSHAIVAGVLVFILGAPVLQAIGQVLPNTGQQITPLAPRDATFSYLNPGLSDFPEYLAGQAVSSVVSPDGKTLLVLTSGYNRLNSQSTGLPIPADSTQFVFVYDIANHRIPVQKQVIHVGDSYSGIVFDPSGTAFYVPDGGYDDVHIYVLGQDGLWSEAPGSPVGLGHNGAGVGLNVLPEAAGVAVTSDGSRLVVANYYNDSISMLAKSGTAWTKIAELDLRPGKLNLQDAGVPGGEYPFWVVIKGNDTAYISSIRDREIVVVNIQDSSPVVVSRIKVPGQPNKMVLNRSQSTLFVAQDSTDSVGVIDTSTNQLVEDIPVTAPGGLLPASDSNFKGNDTNSVTLAPDEKLLYVTNGWMNDIAVVQLGALPNTSRVIGLIPTGWYPNSVSFAADGKYMYVVNYKSPTGPNPGYCHPVTTQQSVTCPASNQYILQLIKAGLQSFPTPTASELQRLTEQVGENNHFGRRLSADDAAKMAFLHQHIHHVIYIIKENRTYDEILGDLAVGNGDPSLAEFGEAITPNLHRLASQFVDLDNFYVTSEVSMDGWPWSTAAHATDVVERQTSPEYAGRGMGDDSEGTNRNVNVSYATLAERLAANPLTPNDPDVMAGTADVAAPDGPDDDEQGTGFLWNAALRAGLSLRNYGFFIDGARYNLPAAESSMNIPELPDPFSTNPPTVVAYATDAALRPYTDPYFRGFDLSFPDYYRFTEWQREFDTNYAAGGLPDLTLLRLGHDHTGNFSTSIAGVNTPELDEADNDYAVGLVVQKIANSGYKNDTLIFVIEDDAQDGGDHVDAHRSIAFVIGAYVKQNAVVSTQYTTLSMFRTIEDILGISPQNLNDDLALPMADVFETKVKDWTFTAAPSDLLYGTELPLPPMAAGHHVLYPKHNAAYWARVTAGMDFSAEDRIDFDRYNHILWEGVMGSKPYPVIRSGLDLRLNRARLLRHYRTTNSRPSVKSPASRAAPK